MIGIELVKTKKQLKRFIDFPHALYSTDANYVPELFIAQRDLLTPGKNPFYENAEMQLFLVTENNEIKGRIAAILNRNHNTFNHTTDGFFGFFDCVNDQAVANMLFDNATKWLKEKGMNRIIGPVNPSTNDPCGMLIDGFDMPPVAMMTYNFPYYNTLTAQYGFIKHVDLNAWDIDDKSYNDRSVRMQNLIEQRLIQRNIIIRTVNLKDFKNEVHRIKDIYNSAWDKNMGFVPMTDNEFEYLAKDLKMVLDKEFCLIAEHEGKPIGFALAIPDINQILIKIKKGRLLPTGIFKLLFGMKKVTGIRVLALGVLEGYRKHGIEGCFYAAIIKHGLKRGIIHCEGSWILENNDAANKPMENVNGKLYKKYRLYERAI